MRVARIGDRLLPVQFDTSFICERFSFSEQVIHYVYIALVTAIIRIEMIYIHTAHLYIITSGSPRLRPG